MSKPEFRDFALSDSQWNQITAFSESLTPGQLLWVSGFLAGVAHRPGQAAAFPAGALAVEAPVATGARKLTVLHGSETGNSTALATDLARRLTGSGREVRLVGMGDYKPRGLKDEQDLLIVTSTYGEGDPPQPAAGFFEFVESRKAPRLPELRFAVLSLGDSTYEHFCEAGRRLDRRFEELGATRLLPRVDCDVDYEDPAAAWTETVVRRLTEDVAALAAPVPAAPLAAQPAPVHDKRNPFLATVIDNLALTGRGSSKETRHVELSLEGSGLGYQPGDALGILPENDPSVVEAVLAALSVPGSAQVTVKGAPMTLAEALTRRFEIATLTPRFLEAWAGFSAAPELRRLTGPEWGGERTAFLKAHHVVDVLRSHPVRGLSPEDFLAALRPLQPRLYSIASSLAAVPDEAHLTVSTVVYELFGEPRSGVASGQIARRAEPDSRLPVFIQPNEHFRLPAGDLPIIMIGAGTGVAPYRGFLQEREARGASGKSWLFFGERNFRSDFLYQTEWQGWLKDGVLSRMDVAFSRDRPEAKTYVQHRLLERSAEVFDWLEQGAHVYVCGDASRLAPDVHAALRRVVARHAGLDDEAANSYLAQLRDSHRYKLDVY